MGSVMAIMVLWLIVLIASISFFIANIVDYRKNKKDKRPVIISGVVVGFVFGVPVLIVLMLIHSLSTGMAGM